VITDKFFKLSDVQLTILQQIFFDLHKFIKLKLIILVADGLVNVTKTCKLDMRNDALREAGLTVGAVLVDLNCVTG